MKRKVVSLFLLILFISVPVCWGKSGDKGVKLENPDSWTLVFIPDIQNYSKYTRNQPILDLMLAWIESHIDSLHIKLVMCPGDLVEYNDWIVNNNDGNVPSNGQWEFVAHAFDRLNGKVPYILATGNHDYSYTLDGKKAFSQYRHYITSDRNALNQKCLRQTAPDCEGYMTMENAAFEMKMPDKKNYLFLSLEYAPRDTVMRWANNVVKLPEYKDDRIVLLTHSYIRANNEYVTGKQGMISPSYVSENIFRRTGVGLEDGNSGKDLWEKLVKPNNIELVLCGHIMGKGFRQDKNVSGQNVYQMLFDAQSEGGGHRNGNGGDGWLRILEFFPDGKTVKVKTFSPLFDCSPSTRHLATRADKENEFTFVFDK